MSEVAADYVVVGAGSAGCALAYRLAEAGREVIVIEAGGSDAGPFIQMPGALSYPMNMRRYDWGFRSEPEPGLDGRRMAVPRGRVIGGSSSINGMVWVRGHPRDFDHWAEAGAAGWAFRDVLPYYKRIETWHGPEPDPGWRGTSGPMHVSRGSRTNPLVTAFVEAGRQAGYPVTEDYNGRQQEGFGPMEATIHRGRRWSAARAYLRPAIRTGRCRVLRGEARRVLFDDGRAAGVELGRGRRVTARREVILAASSINTPKLLMLSGIGPGAHLAEMEIEVRADRPGVGANLQDHLELYVQMASTRPITLARYWSLHGKAWVGALWLMTGRGPGASNQFESCAFTRSAAGMLLSLTCSSTSCRSRCAMTGGRGCAGTGSRRMWGRCARSRAGRCGWAGRTRRRRRRSGSTTCRVRTTAPSSAPACARRARSSTQDAYAPYRGAELSPGPGVETDEEIDAHVAAHAESAYHPCGTARMGARDDPGAVVDPEGRVIGVEGLRVADSSVFPRITNGNLNAPSILVGERVADFVLGRAPLPAEDAGPWEHPAWRVAQR